MLRGIDPNERHEHISKYDLDEPKTVFVLKPLSALDMPENLVTREDMLQMLSSAVVEIKNMPAGIDKDAYLRRLDVLSLGELIGVCNKLNGLTGQETKN